MSSMCHLLPTLYTPSTHPFYTSIKGRDSHLCLFYISSRITSQPQHTHLLPPQHLLYVLLVVQTTLPSFHRKPATIPSIISLSAAQPPFPPLLGRVSVGLSGEGQGSMRRAPQRKEPCSLVTTGLSLEKRRLPTLPHCIAVPSAQAGLTSLFGMGRGWTPPL